MYRANIPKLSRGGNHKDERGTVKFCNDFNMESIRRMYTTTPSIENPIRAWQGHKLEQKWFYCSKGSFIIHLYKPVNWNTPSKDLKPLLFELNEFDSNVLWIPGGYINGFKSLKENSELIIFSDKALSDSQSDDFRYDVDLWLI